MDNRTLTIGAIGGAVWAFIALVPLLNWAVNHQHGSIPTVGWILVPIANFIAHAGGNTLYLLLYVLTPIVIAAASVHIVRKVDKLSRGRN